LENSIPTHWLIIFSNQKTILQNKQPFDIRLIIPLYKKVDRELVRHRLRQRAAFSSESSQVSKTIAKHISYYL